MNLNFAGKRLFADVPYGAASGRAIQGCEQFVTLNQICTKLVQTSKLQAHDS
jgi:hypothetical protein